MGRLLLILLACFVGIACARTSQQIVADDQARMVRDFAQMNELYLDLDRLSDEIHNLTNASDQNTENYEQPREIDVNGDLTSNEAIDAAVTHNPLHTGVTPPA